MMAELPVASVPFAEVHPIELLGVRFDLCRKGFGVVQVGTETAADETDRAAGPAVRIEFRRAAKASVGVARDMARGFMGPGDPAADDVVTVAGELVANAIAHTDGARFWLSLSRTPDGCTVSVEDEAAKPGRRPVFPSSPAEAFTNPTALLAESGRGLAMVAVLCPHDHGTVTTSTGSVTWGTVRRASDD